MAHVVFWLVALIAAVLMGPMGFTVVIAAWIGFKRPLRTLARQFVEHAPFAFMTADAEQETLQRMSDELDEVITSFAETYAQMAELLRLLPRTMRHSEEDLVRARKSRSVRL